VPLTVVATVKAAAMINVPLVARGSIVTVEMALCLQDLNSVRSSFQSAFIVSDHDPFIVGSSE